MPLRLVDWWIWRLPMIVLLNELTILQDGIPHIFFLATLKSWLISDVIFRLTVHCMFNDLRSRRHNIGNSVEFLVPPKMSNLNRTNWNVWKVQNGNNQNANSNAIVVNKNISFNFECHKFVPICIYERIAVARLTWDFCVCFCSTFSVRLVQVLRMCAVDLL